MRSLSHAQSIQHKLSLILIATVGVALLLAALALLVVEARKEWRDAQADLTTQAEVVGLASEAALAFGDRKVAEQNLRVLQVTPGVMAAARAVTFIVKGTEKASIVQRVLSDPAASPLPAQLVRPVHGTLWWMLDRDAAGELT